MSLQKNLFLKYEGNNWHERNKSFLKKKPYKNDFIIKEIEKLLKKNKKKSILEIGCGDGGRLSYLKKNNKIECYGIDPSSNSIKANKNKKIILKKGTADFLPFKKNKFDIIVFSFCLYLCDDSSLLKIMNEAIRVTKKNSYILIYDYYYNGLKYLNYKHNRKIKSRKMDYSRLFLWHPKINLIYMKKIYEKKNLFYKQKKLNATVIHVLEKNF